MENLPAGLWERMLKKRRIIPTGCWLWTGSRTSIAGRPKAQQYGEVRVNYKLRRVHRVTAALRLGFDLSCSKDVCHTCDVPLCFNPAHLFIGTRDENNKDKARKGRASVGEKSGRTGLSEEDVCSIFREHHVDGLGVREIGRRRKMSHAAVSNILNGKRWPHITRQLIAEYKGK